MPGIQETLRFSWDTLKKNPWTIIGAGAIALIVSGVLNGLLTELFPTKGGEATELSKTINFFVSLVFGIIIEMGLVTFMLRAAREPEAVTLHALWNPQPFFAYLVAQIAVAVTVLLGFVLLIVPGVIAALAFMFTPYLIIDKGLKPFEAMKESMRITKGHRVNLFLLMCTVVILNILGLIVLFVGLLVTLPLSMIAVAHVYRALESSPTLTA